MNTIRILGILLLAGCVFATSIDQPQEAEDGSGDELEAGIIDGKKTDISHHPHQVAIEIGGIVIGSGVILDKRHILTSAVVVFPHALKSYKIIVGQTNPYGKKAVEIESVTKHPKVTYGTKYNVAVIKLKKALKFSKHVRPIEIATKSAAKGSSVVVSGWGLDSKHTPGKPKTIIQLKQTIISLKDCKSHYYASTVSSTNICARNSEHKYPTGFDFGDPLVHNNKLVGLFLYDLAVACKTPHNCPSVYTDVVGLRHWISHVIKKGHHKQEDEEEIEEELN